MRVFEVIGNVCYNIAHDIKYLWQMHWDDGYRAYTAPSRRRIRKAAWELREWDMSSSWNENRQKAFDAAFGKRALYDEPDEPVLVYEDPEAARKFEVDYPEPTYDEIETMLDDVAGQIEYETITTEDRTMATNYKSYNITAPAQYVNYANGGVIMSGSAIPMAGGVYPIQLLFTQPDMKIRGRDPVTGIESEFVSLPGGVVPAQFQGAKSGAKLFFKRTRDGDVVVNEANLVAMMEELGFTQIG